MFTVNHTAAIFQLIEKIKALPAPCYQDAYRAAQAMDLSSLSYIANMAEGLPETFSRRLFEMMDLADVMSGAGVRTVEAIKR